ncbi:hypothetical protein BDR06DRAFT_971909 [Suillus hirtellus]|nr:hypothetical protein BDR06DRAFT_971909 [Suillus hirtellus]
MELMEHVDCVGQTSFLTILVWKNIKYDNPYIEHHQLYGKAHKSLTASIPAPISQPPNAPPITNALAVPSLAAKSKPPRKSVTRKTLTNMCTDSDKVKIVGDITKSDPFQKRKQRSTGASEEVAIGHEDKVIALVSVNKDMAEIVVPGPTNITSTRPKSKLKSKRVAIVVSSRSDLQWIGKGRERKLCCQWRQTSITMSGGSLELLVQQAAKQRI